MHPTHLLLLALLPLALTLPTKSTHPASSKRAFPLSIPSKSNTANTPECQSGIMACFSDSIANCQDGKWHRYDCGIDMTCRNDAGVHTCVMKVELSDSSSGLARIARG
ncbi:hypothetical protein HDV00_006386 [Rhizophlyctis rosea]|nr:hypothetical protein HDV00_006386 [Rhizophlyctis rosea]